MTTIPQSMPRVGEIVAVVADYFGMKPGDLTGRRRFKNIAHARMIAMYLVRRLRGESLMQVGEHFGGRDHTTVLHDVRVIDRELPDDEILRARIVILINKLSTEVYDPSKT
jgi:chromosomal replication initiator protein